MAKYQLLRDQIAGASCPTSGAMQALRASDGELALAHTPAYIQAFPTARWPLQ
jgi:hypothetical protein